MNKIEFIDCESGDWVVVKVDDAIFHEGHDVPMYIWIELLEKLGVEVVETYISDEDMEYGRY